MEIVKNMVDLSHTHAHKQTVADYINITATGCSVFISR